MKQYIIATLFDDILHCFCFVFAFCLVWCPCMAIDVSVQYNGGLLPDIIPLTQFYYGTIGEPVSMPWRGFVFAAYDPT